MLLNKKSCGRAEAKLVNLMLQQCLERWGFLQPSHSILTWKVSFVPLATLPHGNKMAFMVPDILHNPHIVFWTESFPVCVQVCVCVCVGTHVSFIRAEKLSQKHSILEYKSSF